ncbi:conserved hypothetical protein [groundwater metagenome]|uniref:Polymerase/histidinol phosphatase N-terminal domain-containing protein n=1 Tax=groundwater metagenome TaxID=717931 RepID=A0A098E7R5_9ZZZZ
MIKTWQKYEKFLMSGNWHIHTNYTDGKDKIFDICEIGSKKNIPLIAFTEHVRKNLSYNFADFLNDIEEARKIYRNIIILSGCEAKILPGGEIDVSEDILTKVDYPIIAFHSFPNDKDLYLKSIKKAIENKYVNTLAHPGYFLIKNKLPINNNEVMDILTKIKENNVLLEINTKYGLPPRDWIESAIKIGVRMVRGNDAHSKEEV